MFSIRMRYFMEVARQGSIRKAAAQLYIAASAVDRHVLALEDELGCALFERLPRGVRLTPAGQIVFDTSKQLQRDYDVAISDLDLLRQAKRGHVTIATLQLLAEDFFPSVLRELLNDYPGITYTVHTGNSVEIARMIAENDVDIGLVWEPRQGAMLHRIKTVKVPFGVALPASHPLRSREEIQLRECAGYPVVFPTGGELREVLDRLQQGLKERITPAIETASISMLRTLVREGTGIALTSLVAVLRHVISGEIVFRPLKEHVRLSTALTLFVKDNRKLPTAVGLVADRLADRFPSMGQIPSSRGRSRRRA